MATYILVVCSFVLLTVLIVNNTLHKKRKQKLLMQMKETMKKISNE